MIIGHQKQWRFLKESVELGKISHAYLFSGQGKLGKKTLAFEFVKLLNCQNPDFSKKPCQNCQSCQEIQKALTSHTEQHPDLAIIEHRESVSAKSALSGKEIQISQIRELSWRLSLRPFSAPFKTAIIDEAHLMNQEAQTSLLKTLEEPKGKAVLILVTEYPEMLFPTILSRVQKIKFYSLPFAEIENFLKREGASEKVARELALLSLGKPGAALDYFHNPKILENQKQKIADLVEIVAKNSDLASRFHYAKDLSQENQNLKETLEVWLRYFRRILIKKINGSISGIGNLVGYSIPKLEGIIKKIQNTLFLISTTNINPRLALEILMIEL